MTDEEFIDYCDIHSRTERALFSGKQIHRLLTLTGKALGPVESVVDGWFSMHFDVAEPLIKEARERLRKAKVQARDELLAAGFVEGLPET